MHLPGTVALLIACSVPPWDLFSPRHPHEQLIGL